MAGQLQPITQSDFSGGLNLAANPYLIPRKQVWRVRNLVLDEQGALRTRPGSSTLYTTNNITRPLRLVKLLNKVDGTSIPYAIDADGVNSSYWKLTTNPYTNFGNIAISYQTPQAVTVLDKDLIARGYIIPATFDGTTILAIGSQPGQTTPPGAKHVAFHLGSVWLWNTNGTTTSLDGPSAIRMAAAGTTNDWPNSNQAFIGKDDGQVGMGLATYTIVETGISPISTLIAFKNFSAYQITGVFGASNFAIQQVKTDMGCIAPRSIQFISGFGIIRLTHKGFSLYNGVDDKLISEEIRPAIFGNDQTDGDIPGIDFSRVEISFAGQVQNPPLYICACSVAGGNGTLTRLFTFDLIRKAWTILDFPYPLSWIGSVFLNNEGNLWAGHNSNGTVYRLMGVNDTTDNGAAIDWNFRTGPITTGDSTNPSYWRRVALDLVYAPYQAINYQITLGGVPTGLSGTRTPSPLVTAGRTDIDIKRKVPWVYGYFNGSGNVRFRTLTWQLRRTPLSKVRL